MKWYKKMHLARMDDVPFDKMKPPKDFQEGLNQAGEFATKHVSNFGNFIGGKAQEIKLDQVFGQAKEGISKTGEQLGQSAIDLKQHVINAKIGEKFMSMFKSKKKDD